MGCCPVHESLTKDKLYLPIYPAEFCSNNKTLLYLVFQLGRDCLGNLEGCPFLKNYIFKRLQSKNYPPTPTQCVDFFSYVFSFYLSCIALKNKILLGIQPCKVMCKDDVL